MPVTQRAFGAVLALVALAMIAAPAAAQRTTARDVRCNGCVDSSDLGKNAVSKDDIANNTVSTKKIKNNAVRANKIRNNAVTGAKIADGAVTGAKIANGAVTAADLAAGSVGSSELGNNAVTTGKIQNGTITGVDIADGAITATKIPDGSITGAKIANGTVTGAHIGNNAIDGTNVMDGGLTALDLGDGAGADFALGADEFLLEPNIDRVVGSVTVDAPMSGFVVLIASGRFLIFSNATVECSWTKGPVVEAFDFQSAGGLSETHDQAFYMTEGFAVPAGPTTFNVVCQAPAGAVVVDDADVTAFYAPTQY